MSTVSGCTAAGPFYQTETQLPPISLNWENYLDTENPPFDQFDSQIPAIAAKLTLEPSIEILSFLESCATSQIERRAKRNYLEESGLFQFEEKRELNANLQLAEYYFAEAKKLGENARYFAQTADKYFQKSYRDTNLTDYSTFDTFLNRDVPESWTKLMQAFYFNMLFPTIAREPNNYYYFSNILEYLTTDDEYTVILENLSCYYMAKNQPKKAMCITTLVTNLRK